MNKKCLIFGASGGLGQALAKECLKMDLDFIGTFCTSPTVLLDNVPEAKNRIVQLDLTDSIEEKLKVSGISDIPFNFGLSTVAMSDVDACWANPLVSFSQNVSTNINAAIFCFKRNIPFYYVSTNDVFGSQTARKDPVRWSVSEEPSPVGIYARHKRTTEEIILDLARSNKAKARVVRLSLISLFKSHGQPFFMKLMESIKMGKDVFGITDQFVNPIFVQTASREIINDAVNRISTKEYIHIAPVDYASRYEMIEMVINFLQKNNKKFIHPKFKLEKATLAEMYERKLMIDERPHSPILIPSITTKYTLEEEIHKAILEYFGKK